MSRLIPRANLVSRSQGAPGCPLPMLGLPGVTLSIRTQPAHWAGDHHMKRREFITVLGGAAAAWPLAGLGQQIDRVRRVGVLVNSSENDPEKQSELGAFRARLAELGWIEGRNIQFDYRWTDGRFDRLSSYAAELIGLSPDAVLATNAPTLVALQKETRSVPLVFVQVVDPVTEAFVPSLANPGGNITGFTHFEHAIGGKWLQLLKEIAPRVNKVIVLWNPKNVSVNGFMLKIKEAAPPLAVETVEAHVQNAADIEHAIAGLAHGSNTGLIVPPDFTTVVNRAQITALTARNNLPAIYPFRLFVTSGGLISYGINLREMYVNAASYFDRILRGEKPADLPVQTPTKYELIINLKVAKALGLDVPTSLLFTADEVIE
jgi:putative ABC transport system substrate-binding protein